MNNAQLNYCIAWGEKRIRSFKKVMNTYHPAHRALARLHVEDLETRVNELKAQRTKKAP